MGRCVYVLVDEEGVNDGEEDEGKYDGENDRGWRFGFSISSFDVWIES